MLNEGDRPNPAMPMPPGSPPTPPPPRRPPPKPPPPPPKPPRPADAVPTAARTVTIEATPILRVWLIAGSWSRVGGGGRIGLTDPGPGRLPDHHDLGDVGDGPIADGPVDRVPADRVLVL